MGYGILENYFMTHWVRFRELRVDQGRWSCARTYKDTQPVVGAQSRIGAALCNKAWQWAVYGDLAVMFYGYHLDAINPRRGWGRALFEAILIYNTMQKPRCMGREHMADHFGSVSFVDGSRFRAISRSDTSSRAIVTLLVSTNRWIHPK